MLFTLRLVPVFPFFIINLAMGLTSMRVLVFAFVSQAGMLPGTLVYVNAGTRLGELESLAGILSPALWLSFLLLGVFPLVAKKAVDALRARRVYRGFRRPRRFDRDLVVIGAGSAGLVSSLIGTTVRAKVTLIERDEMGGDCLNTGCVPSKSLIRSAKFLSHVARAGEFGIRRADADFDFGEIMARVRRNIERIAPHDSVERYEGLGVECVRGEAFIESPFAVRVGDRTITTRNIVIATGAAPFVPPIPGVEGSGALTSETVWGLDRLPRPPRRGGRRTHRVRARAMLRAVRLPGVPGSDPRPPVAARGSRVLRAGRRKASSRRRRGAHRSSGGRVPARG